MSDTVLSNFTQTVKEERKFDRIYKVAIIGTGWIAEAHIESYLAQPDVEVVALADIIPGKAAAFAKQYGIENARIYGHHDFDKGKACPSFDAKNEYKALS